MVASWRGTASGERTARFGAASRRGVRGRGACRPGRALVGALLLTALLGAACVSVAGCGAGHPASASPVYEVRSGFVRGLGQIVTDGHGFTLYIYVPDHQGPSVCTEVCATQWPPLVLPRGVGRPLAGPGVNPALLGTTRRAGGSLQVTYNRWPLYLWQADLAPGQATGQGEGMGAWYTMSVSGSVDRLPLP